MALHSTLEDQRELIRRGEISERGLVLVAMDGEAVVGLLDLWAGDRPDNRHAGRFGMSVARARRGQGVGRRLLEAAIAETRTWPGFCRIELEVAPWNAPAIALYARLGFRLEAWKSKALVLTDEPEDMLVMALTW